jgi:hypothetical protein
MCCGNASENCKLKLGVIGKSKKTTIVQGYQSKLYSCQLLNQKGAWIHRKIFENWFHKYFVPEV